MIEQLYADALLQRGELQQALKVYQQLWKRYDGDHRLAKSYSRVLMLGGNLQEAQKVIHHFVVKNPDDYQALLFYGNLLDRLSTPWKKHEFMAKYFANQGEYKHAVQQIEQALRTPNISSEEKLRLTSLMRRYQALIK